MLAENLFKFFIVYILFNAALGFSAFLSQCRQANAIAIQRIQMAALEVVFS